MNRRGGSCGHHAQEGKGRTGIRCRYTNTLYPLPFSITSSIYKGAMNCSPTFFGFEVTNHAYALSVRGLSLCRWVAAATGASLSSTLAGCFAAEPAIYP